MRVFAIIVTYNGIEWLDKCLTSLKNSTVVPQIVVVDNGSKDGTVDYIKQNFPEVILMEPELNLGFGRGNNLGIKYAIEHKADFVFLLNQDAWVNENTIERLIYANQHNPEFGIISPVHLNGKGTALDIKFSDYVSERNCPGFVSDFFLKQPVEKPYSVPFVNAAVWLLPITTIEKVGGFNELFFMYGEDDEYCVRAIQQKIKVGVYKPAIAYHARDNYFYKKHSYLTTLRKKFFLQKADRLRNYFVHGQSFLRILSTQCVMLFKTAIRLQVTNVTVRLIALINFIFRFPVYRRVKEECKSLGMHFLN